MVVLMCADVTNDVMLSWQCPDSVAVSPPYPRDHRQCVVTHRDVCWSHLIAGHFLQSWRNIHFTVQNVPLVNQCFSYKSSLQSTNWCSFQYRHDLLLSSCGWSGQESLPLTMSPSLLHNNLPEYQWPVALLNEDPEPLATLTTSQWVVVPRYAMKKQT